MKWNKHSDLEGKHAFLGASKYHWLNYSHDKLAETFLNEMAKEKGTRLHAFAAEAIDLGIYLKGRSTIALFVNDGIDFGMSPETVVFYSYNCFGTADAISFEEERRRDPEGHYHKRPVLRISDLKTGKIQASEKQLMIYAALFCLEYGHNPKNMDIELRIYQTNAVSMYIPEADEILEIMELIKDFDDYIENLKKEA